MELHRLFYRRIDELNAGRYRDRQVFITGTDFLPPAPKDVPGDMAAFVRWANESRASTHPVEWAALVHLRFVSIHPFVDGNGRTARLLTNLMLLNAGYGMVIVPPILRGDYMQAIRLSQSGKASSATPFVSFIAECVLETQRDYCRLLRIDPPDRKPPEQS